MQRDACELSVIATGFKSTVPGMNLTSRFPGMGEWYESADLPNVHYIGWLMQKFDYQRGSGGFLQGYRYLIRNLMHRIREVDEGVEYPYLILDKGQVAKHVAYRLDIVSDLILMQDGVILRDVIIPIGDGFYKYFESATYQFHEDIRESKPEETIYVYFVWGDTRRAEDVFDNVNRYTDTKALRNGHIHPAVEVNGLIREMEEDIAVDWGGEFHQEAAFNTINAALEGDLSSFRPIQRTPYVRHQVNMTIDSADSHERGVGQGAYDPIPPDLISGTVKSILSKYDTSELASLREVARKWLPYMD